MDTQTPPEDVQTVYVGANDTALLKCANCGIAKTLDVGKFKGRKDPLKLQCKCKSSSQVFLEFRKSFRRTKVDACRDHPRQQLGPVQELTRGSGFGAL